MDELQELGHKTIWGSRFPTLDFTEGLSMRSIWTRLHGFDTNERADPVTPQATGGGEGVSTPDTPALSSQEKPVEPTQDDAKNEPVTETVPAPAPAVPEVPDAAAVEQNGVSKPTEDWQKRESELLQKIEQLELVKNERTEDGLRLELKVREEEIDLLKARVNNLETELQAALARPGAGGKNHEVIENIKQQHEELLSKARGMIFDKTKMVKNQELQIQALTTQVQSLKDINSITKDLLEIRNSEMKAMEERLEAMEARFKGEKERYALVLQRATTTTTVNDDLRKEYETQLGLFRELREKYEQRVQALVSENARLKDVITAKNNVAAHTPNSGSSA